MFSRRYGSQGKTLVARNTRSRRPASALPMRTSESRYASAVSRNVQPDVEGGVDRASGMVVVDDPVAAAERVAAERQSRHQRVVVHWWTSIGSSVKASTASSRRT